MSQGQVKAVQSATETETKTERTQLDFKVPVFRDL